MSKPTSTTAPSSYYSALSSSSTTTKSKRHSLAILPPASPGPRPLHLLDGTITSSSTSASSPLHSPSTSSKASRRQSSISYYPPDRTPDYYTSSSITLSNAGRSPLSARGTQHAGAGLSRSSSVGRGSPGLKGRHGEIQRMSLPLEKEKEKERPPLTLAEKRGQLGPSSCGLSSKNSLRTPHAELLHFIAQKESKCLELRSQLAVHEEELLQLKRKWERIVNRGFEKSQSPPDAVSRAPPNTITNPASTVVAGLTGPAVLEGIKEGMHRFLAAGLSISDPNSTPSSPSPLSASPLPLSGQRSSPLLAERSSPLSGGPTTPRWRTHAREKESLSSVSTHATATSATTRYSQCSSSTAASSLGGKELGGDDVEDGQEPLGESDNFCAAPELMVHDTGATPTMSPNPAFKRKERQQGAIDPQQPVPGEPQPQSEPDDDDDEFDEATFTSSLDLTPSGGAKVRRRKSKDVVPLHWSSGLSAIEPGLTANTATASSVGSSRVPSPLPELEGTAKIEGGTSGREKTNGNTMRATLNTNGHGYAAQSDGRFGGGVYGMGSLPPPSSIPGLGVLTGGGATWMGSVGKKLGELRDSPAYVYLSAFSIGPFSWASRLFDHKMVPDLGSAPSFCLPWFLTVMLMSSLSVYSFTKSQKRASVLLSDVSQSIVSAWNAPTTPIGSAPPISRTRSTPLPTSPLSPSLLDDDNDDTIRIASVMTPDSKKLHTTTLMPSWPDGGMKPSNKPTTTSSNAKTQDEDEEWNW
ncbi:uncharacterized protein LACBIDRAFT_328400 [Laccaria bicolor S238N-H82]|uniref:Predicted protein n=1 Tax=Laccaria bicolor (strain S238N-H82 / ATCC MYA-4686) TaxID=486041 RepID=B0DER6_LACBS|nr:uncharacterized protein LACBIDRAFT_328400 [Laccaria bicolor S238N-H82]EDR06988.1 predicted protein [Laccaria bicolor S238N-H82]|eukprot:XP_001882361.1 predicted protein [Laccaria bicolor S238N-H82]